uniref:DUF599 domain-containing protein n=1 Tax=Ananas comosus var. bracteatus TaxID=296719 RepID=A0A6V7PQY7_ANACO|nr:unnamed protein product [Ananas comosus var. bracteatus]
MDLSKYPLDIILVPLSLCLTACYHGYIWQSSKAQNTTTSIGITMKRRARWVQSILQENKKKDILGVQSLRNLLMSTILSATVAMLVNTALAALANNTYNAFRLHGGGILGLQGGPMVVLKYASISLLLLISFLCSSMGVGFIVEGNFLLNAPADAVMFDGHVEKMIKRGWVLATVGNRVLFSTFPFLLWLYGPVALAVSSVGLILVFYCFDFGSTGLKQAHIKH